MIKTVYGESSDSESSEENSNENTSTVNNQPVSKLKILACIHLG